MSTCFLKRFVPFLLTLVIGLCLGTLFKPGGAHTQFKQRLYIEHTHSLTTTLGDAKLARSYTNDSTPLAIFFEPPVRMTEAARRNHTYGVVQLLVEYGVDAKARVVERIETLPDGLTEEAERVTEQTQFRPQTINGKFVPTLKIKSYYFEMNQ